jgi:hypothetical protein
MISTSDFSKLITKYALVLIIFYLIQYLISLANSFFINRLVLADQTKFWSSYTVIVFGFIFNIITALIVRFDINKLQLKSRYLILATLVWRPLGICLFFITIVNQARSDN